MNEIMEKAKKGLALDDLLVIDCHCHMGSWHNFYIPESSAEGMLKGMDALGIDIACPAANSAIGPDYKHGNDMIIAAVKKYPERFAGYVTISPHYPEDIGNELERCFAVPGMRAIKLHPSSHRCHIDYKNYKQVYETADKKQCPVLLHVFNKTDVAIVKKLAGIYPGAQFIMGHAGAEIRAMEDAIDVVNALENVYVDLAISYPYEGNVEWFVKEMGSRKVLYGSDMPFFDARPAFGRVAMADISLEDKKNVFGLNMKRLLKL